MQMTKPQQNQTQCCLNAFRVIMITFQVGEAHAIRFVCVCVRVCRRIVFVIYCYFWSSVLCLPFSLRFRVNIF